MEAEAFKTRIESARETELARLGSDRRLVAVTEADISLERVLAAAYETEVMAMETFAQWADTERDQTVATVFSDIVTTERRHRDRIAEHLSGDPPDVPADPVSGLHRHLRTVNETRDRVAAGLTARPILGSRTLLQFVNFFVNEANRSGAELFRDLRSETDAQLEQGMSLIGSVCSTDEDWEKAEQAALTAIDVVYEEYVAALTDMGLDPKPVC